MSRPQRYFSRTSGALAALTAASALVRLLHLRETGAATGTDGYYYLVQVEDLVSEGALHVPDGSWVLRALAAPHALGLPALDGLMLGSAALAAAAVPLGWLAGRRLGGPAAGWWLALWAAGSPSLTLLAAEFPKNLGVIPAGLALLASPTLSLYALGAALLTFTAHRTGAALLLTGGAGAAAGGRPRIALGLGGALLIGGALAAWGGGLGTADLARLEGSLSLRTWPPLVGVIALTGAPWPLAAELWLGWLALLGAPWLLRDPNGRGWRAALLAGIAVCVAVPWQTATADLGYRLALLAPALSAPLLAVWLGARRPLTQAGSVALAVLALGISPSGYRHADAPPYGSWAALIATVPRPLPSLMITPVGLSFLYDHLTGEEAMAWAPEPALDRDAVGRLAVGIDPEDWEAWGEGEITWLRGDWAYLGEGAWEAYCERAPAELIDPRNPREVRPAWLTRGRSAQTEGAP